MGGYFNNWTDWQIIKFLEQNGFNRINTHGDDHIYFNDSTNASVKVTSPKKSTPIGTMMNIVRHSKIPKGRWLEFRENNFK
jgi:predicted RNA binding protein YcfA (HicA-like mRNA interferase family)